MSLLRQSKEGFLEAKAKAKINLSLDVIRKRPDGYHEVEMIMQTVSLHDTVRLEKIEGKDGGVIEIACNCSGIPSGRGNTAHKAAELFLRRFGIKDGVKIRIIKRIPIAAGLAGGSSDAAAVLKGMNILFDTRVDETELLALGKLVGADVPYCIKGGSVLARGIGEVLTVLRAFPETFIIIVKPGISVSTAWVYNNLNLEEIKERPDTEMLLKAIDEGAAERVALNMKNVLESVTSRNYGVIDKLKSRLLELGAAGSMMSGSGPAVFGIFPDRQSAFNACKVLKSEGWECYLTVTDNHDS